MSTLKAFGASVTNGHVDSEALERYKKFYEGIKKQINDIITKLMKLNMIDAPPFVRKQYLEK